MQSKEKILLVDDEPRLLRSCYELLATRNYSIATAEGGKQAIEALKSETFDLVLLDLNMPEVDGHQVMKFMRDNQIDTVVIVLSGETSFDYVSKAFLLGAYDFIQKPYEFDALMNGVENALRKKRLEKENEELRKRLEESERLHRFMIESSPDIIYMVDENGYFTYINDRAQELLGYEKDELIGLHYTTIIRKGNQERGLSDFRLGPQLAENEEIWIKCKNENGQTRYFETKEIAIAMNAMGLYQNRGQQEEEDQTFVGTYVVARDITERLESERLIHFQAYHDLLTRLPNRALFLDRLSNAISNVKRENGQLAVMFLDLDRFKMVNDTLGHSTGDNLLQEVANRLRSCLREGDTLARLGGDEFIVLLPNISSERVSHKVAKKIINALKDPFYLTGHELFVTASIGIAMYPRDGRTAEVLIKNSDIAMYHTKDQGKNGYYLYEGNMSEWHHRQLSMENDIRKGIRDNQFELHYQPQVNSNTGVIAGVEALLRWNHPEKGLVAPSFFLPVAEDSGLIVELGDWVLNAALKEVQSWRQAGVEPGRLAVNFSAKQIEQKDFVEKIISAIEVHDYPGNLLEVEITEGTLMNDIEDTVSKLSELSEAGISVAIDDFGTGYSSLSLLQKLPINRLKIDRSFIHELHETSNDLSIIEAIAHMARGLKLDMVAEGVEEEFQVRFLRNLDCPIIQGFIFSQGLPAEEARLLVQNSGLKEKLDEMDEMQAKEKDLEEFI